MNEQPKPIIKNCSTCAHSYNEDGSENYRQCRITGLFCDVHRKHLPRKGALCDENFSAWVYDVKKTKTQHARIYTILFRVALIIWATIATIGFFLK